MIYIKKNLIITDMKSIKNIWQNIINESEQIAQTNDMERNLLKILSKALKHDVNDIIASRELIVSHLVEESVNESSVDDVKNKILNGDTVAGSNEYRSIDTSNFMPEPTRFDGLASGVLFMASGDVDGIREMYCFEPWEFQVRKLEDKVEFIDFIVPKTSLKQFIKEMHDAGFFANVNPELIRNSINNGPFYRFSNQPNIIELCNNWTFVRFLPYSYEDNRKIIRQNSRYLYHFCPSVYVDNILKIGIIVDNRAHPDYPKRVFSVIPCRQDLSNWDYISHEFPIEAYVNGLISRLINNMQKQNKQMNRNDYSCLKIDIDKIPNSVHFGFDFNSYPYAVFCEDTIPSDAIIDVKTYSPYLKYESN